MRTKIYVLYDEGDAVRYVGKTSHSVSKRLSRHIADARNGVVSHKACWIKGMMAAGLLPVVQVIETVDGDGCECEQWWIAEFKKQGARLTNLTDGGEGMAGYKRTDEQKAAQSKRLKEYYETHPHHSLGVVLPQETRDRMSEARKGCKLSVATKAKISTSRKGCTFSDEHRRNLSLSHKGSKHRNFGKALSESTKAKISAGVALAHAEGRTATIDRAESGRFVTTGERHK